MHDDIGAALGQHDCVGTPHARCRTGDQRRFSLQ
jgi:hypothetical protein